MSNFDDILNAPLPSADGFSFEAAADDEEKDTAEEKDGAEKDEKTNDRQSVVDKIEKALEDVSGVKLTKDLTKDFLSGDDDEMEFDDLEDDQVDDVYDAISKALDGMDEFEVEKDDNEVTISVKESAEEDSTEEDSADGELEEDDDMSDSSQQESSDDEAEEGAGCSECEETDDDDEIDDILDELENKTEDELSDELDDVDPDGEDDDEDEPIEPEQKKLDEVEDQKADDMLAMVATPMLIKDELTAEESVNFYESVEADIAIDEGLMMESSLDEMYTEGVFASPNKPFKMTKQARLRQLYELSVQIEARAHRDPLMKQLDKAYAIERRIKKIMRKKYHTQATKRAKGYLMRLIKSKSGVLKNLGKKIAPSK